MKVALLTFLLITQASALEKRTFDVYDIDVEGGKCVLAVSPSGESLLFDLGWPAFNGRDSDRIVTAAKAAGLKQIDYLVVSHYDLDHMGDVPLLMSKFPIKTLVDHGPVETSGKGAEQRYQSYSAMFPKVNHLVVKPGDRIPIKGLDVLVITAGGKWIDKPLKGAGKPNPLCATTPVKANRPEDQEDNSSIGLLFTSGNFRMLDLADFEWDYDHKLMCPNNPVGTVDAYQVSIHGQDKGVSPVLAQALHARVALMGNGTRKGGAPATWETLKTAPGMEDIWQLHYSEAGGKEHNPPDDYIANPQGTPIDEAHWLKLSAQPNGTFTVTNTRNNFTKTYNKR
ncbi:MAG: competence protein ComEC [Bryobacterales bacterium]|jgi:beta-lactamase superfamily II metal-dependent hydrolase|nr:competence protein ComEC [Bryobacterales bacterium]